jgi:bacterioferritin-associated ferredoxin
MILCHCRRISRKEIERLKRKNKKLSLEEIIEKTQASDCCGSCLRDLEVLLNELESSK